MRDTNLGGRATSRNMMQNPRQPKQEKRVSLLRDNATKSRVRLLASKSRHALHEKHTGAATIGFIHGFTMSIRILDVHGGNTFSCSDEKNEVSF